MQIIIWKHYGQLGNRLLTFSHLISLGISRGWGIYNPSFKEYAIYFKHFRAQPVPSYRPKKTNILIENALASEILWKAICALLAKKRFLDVLRSRGLLVESEDTTTLTSKDLGFLFAGHNQRLLVWLAWNVDFNETRALFRPDLLEIFRPIQPIETSVEKRLASLSQLKKTIGVHVRRGDYKSFLGGIYFFSYQTYRQLMLRLLDIYGSHNVQFLIFSNEKVPSSLLIGLPAVYSDGSEIEDIYCLSKCDLIVGPPSTFTEWASFYGGVKRLVFTGELPVKI